jgi:hypothetical protein
MERHFHCRLRSGPEKRFMPHRPFFLCKTLPLAIASAFAASFGVSFSTAGHAQTQASGTVDVDFANSAQALARVNAGYAYVRNITGAGVTIGVLDAGISPGHREFSSPGKVLPGFNAIDGSSNVTDRVGHGTHVAGLIAADRDGKGTMGIAYGASLLPIKVLGDDGRGSTQLLDRGLRHAIGKASIVNISIGSDGNFNPAVMKEAVRAGMLVVAAAGNLQAANPGWPARFAREAWANNQIIAVGAVDASNRIAAFSNRAGDTAGWYLVAPGVNVLSAYLNGQYATMSGTSMAAPLVSGAAALLKQQWPSLTADQIANILFVTATDLGAPGIDPVYGRGLLNVEKALRPIGALTTTTLNGKTINVLSGSTQVSSATTRLWSMAASGQLHVVGLDGYQRDYQVDLGNTVTRPAGLSLDQVFGSIDRRVDVVERVLPDGSQLSVAYSRMPGRTGVLLGHDEGRDTLAAMSFVSRGKTQEFGLGTGSTAARFFGAGQFFRDQDAQGLSLGSVAALDNPYFSLVPGASHAGVAGHAGDYTLKLGVLSSSLGLGLDKAIGPPDVWMPGTSGKSPRARSSLFELSRDFGEAAMSLSVGRTDEASGYLGSYSTGPLMLGADTSTRALQLAGAVRIGYGLALAAQAAYAVTPGNFNYANLITEVGATRTNAFSLALVAADKLLPNDRLTVSLSQPMRTYAGMMAMDVYTGLDEEGRPTREKVRFSMVPFGRELRGELNYSTPLSELSSVGMTLMLRSQPNHQVDMTAEKLVALRYRGLF